MPSAAPASPSAETVLTDTVGRLIEFWGFNRNMGRVWALLYVSLEPMNARDIRDRLKISAGAVSTMITELQRWGVVRKVWIQGERKSHYAAEVNLWRMISRVLNERERREILVAIEGFEEALRALESARRSAGAEQKRILSEQAARIQQLLELAKLGRSLLDALLATSKLDAGPLTRFLLRSR